MTDPIWKATAGNWTARIYEAEDFNDEPLEPYLVEFATEDGWTPPKYYLSQMLQRDRGLVPHGSYPNTRISLKTLEALMGRVPQSIRDRTPIT